MNITRRTVERRPAGRFKAQREIQWLEFCWCCLFFFRSFNHSTLNAWFNSQLNRLRTRPNRPHYQNMKSIKTIHYFSIFRVTSCLTHGSKHCFGIDSCVWISYWYIFGCWCYLNDMKQDNGFNDSSYKVTKSRRQMNAHSLTIHIVYSHYSIDRAQFSVAC